MLEAFVEQCPIALVELDHAGQITKANRAFYALLELPMKPGHPSQGFSDLLEAGDRTSFDEMVERVRDGLDSSASMTVQVTTVTGRELTLTLNLTAIAAEKPTETHLFVFLNDITEQKNLEMRFAHSQKMQAVGQLAGGVAHDFNNLLTAMLGFCDLLLMRHPAGDPSFADIMQIKQNANRAANLVRQLLAFSRRQTLQPKTLDLVDLISELSNLLRRLIGENIELDIQHQRSLWQVKVDQGQLEQVLINLAVNARDAMTQGGTLAIHTRNISIASADELDASLRMPPQEERIAPGDYVEVVIADEGGGIPEEVIDNIFEPFFSTKEVGSGTGLGLSTVYGIIKQTGGYIYLKTEMGQGTSFHLYIPRLIEEGAAARETKEASEAQDLTGAATILLVEDETPVRVFASRALENKGYKVLEADCGEHGLEVFEANSSEIEVIITDVVMPGMNGPEMIEVLDEKWAEVMSRISVIFMSGYTEEAFADGYQSERAFNFLSKPFTLKQLAAKLKEVASSSA